MTRRSKNKYRSGDNNKYSTSVFARQEASSKARRLKEPESLSDHYFYFICFLDIQAWLDDVNTTTSLYNH